MTGTGRLETVTPSRRFGHGNPGVDVDNGREPSGKAWEPRRAAGGHPLTPVRCTNIP
jgi:hypothetical protein